MHMTRIRVSARSAAADESRARGRKAREERASVTTAPYHCSEASSQFVGPVLPTEPAASGGIRPRHVAFA